MAIQHLTKENFDSVTGQGRSLVDFWASWCGPCRMLAPTVEALGEALDGQVQVCKVDVDAEPALAERFGVMSIPTLVYLENGEEKRRLVGVQPQSAIEAMLE